MSTHYSSLQLGDDLSEQVQLRVVVKQVGKIFNNPEIRESSYIDFHDDSLVISGFPQNLPANKDRIS